jgi:uncharacterized cysteine cluster protein YcgN (CxxCxxCC family)
MNTESEPFWKTKTLQEITRLEWESLCDRCGVCCLHRLKNGTTGKVYFTSVACRFLNIEQCVCTIYNDSARNCLKINPQNVRRFRWLPKTCAYRLILENKQLAWWHPLVSGNFNTVHEEGISVRQKVISETGIHLDNLEEYMVKKPFTVPF